MERTSLFREEVLRERAGRLRGDVIVAQPLGARVLTPLCAVLLLALGTFIGSQEYARTEAVQGYLGASVGVSKLSPPRAGSVSEVRVQVGDAVVPGQILLTASADEALVEGGGLSAALRRDLLEQRDEWTRKLEVQESLFAQQQGQAREQAQALRAQLQQLEALRALAAERCQIADEKARAYAELLSRDMASLSQLREERDRALALRSELRRLDADALEKQAQLARLTRELEAAPLRHEQDKADLRLELAQLATRLTETASRSSYAIAAPIAGRIAALQAAPGSALDPSLPVAVILPEGGRLEVHLLVPTRAIGFIEPGQVVGVKYAAFPYQQFGMHRARVARVDGTVLAPEELRTPLRVAEPVYRLVAALDEQDVRAYGRSYPLQLGMLLEAEIVLEHRTILQWLLEPLYGLQGAA